MSPLAENQRAYELHGQKYPRLTRVLSILRDPEIDDWRARVGDAVADRRMGQAQRRGTTLHRLIATTLKTGTLAKLPKGASLELRNGWAAWVRWYHLQPALDVLSVEEPYISAALGYGATPDYVRPFQVVEWKATGAIVAKHWIQVQAEVPLIWPGATAETVSVRIVRLDVAVADFEDVRRPYDPAVVAQFQHLKEVYMAWYGGEMG